MRDRIAVGLTESVCVAIDALFLHGIVLHGRSETNSTAGPQFDPGAEHRAGVHSPRKPANGKKPKYPIANEISLCDGAAASAEVAARFDEVTWPPTDTHDFAKSKTSPPPTTG